MKLKVIVGCEESGAVRRAFRELGHDAWSCDLLPARDNSPYHIQGDILEVLNQGWDLGIFFPPCTFLCLSGVRWLYKKSETNGIGYQTKNIPRWEQMEDAALFFRRLLHADIPHIAVENPIQHKYARQIIETPYSQTFQPYQFGHGEVKRTCLWLKNLPLLKPTNIVEGRKPRIHHMPPGPNRSRDRSETYEGIARAMALQWSKHVLQSMGAAPYGHV